MSVSAPIDITNLVGTLKDTFIRWATTTLVAAATSVAPFLAWPVISTLFSYFINLGVSTLANALEMEGFFLNTAIRKSSQAQDYISANQVLKALPPTASDEEYENAEKNEMAAFRAFVWVAN